jgi:hypothetical protein
MVITGSRSIGILIAMFVHFSAKHFSPRSARRRQRYCSVSRKIPFFVIFLVKKYLVAACPGEAAAESEDWAKEPISGRTTG